MITNILFLSSENWSWNWMEWIVSIKENSVAQFACNLNKPYNPNALKNRFKCAIPRNSIKFKTMKRQQHRNYYSQLWKFVAGIPRTAMWCRQTGSCSFQFQAHNWTTLYTINWCFFFFLECFIFIFSRKIKRERQRENTRRCAAQQRYINSLFIPSKSSVRLAILSYTDTFTQYSSNYIYYLVARDTQHLNETRNTRVGNQVLSLCSSFFF